MSETDAYYERAESWAVDSRALASRSRRVAWIVAAFAAGVAVFEAIALAMLAPLKTVQPITLLVDRQTGYVQSIDPLQPRRISSDAALTQSLLAQYVIAREGFDRAIAATDYRKVALWSADRARTSYVASMPATNPASPFQRYPAGTVITVHVKSVSPLSQSTALVRFDTLRLDRNGGVAAAEPWISVVRYRFVNAPMSMDDRLVNPLGFQVWSYRRDAEAPPIPTPVATVVVQPQALDTRSVISIKQAVSPQAQAYPQQSQSLPLRPLRQPPREITRREVPSNQLPLGSPLVSVQP